MAEFAHIEDADLDQIVEAFFPLASAGQQATGTSVASSPTFHGSKHLRSTAGFCHFGMTSRKPKKPRKWL